jgi:hypothetical protein
VAQSLSITTGQEGVVLMKKDPTRANSAKKAHEMTSQHKASHFVYIGKVDALTGDKGPHYADTGAGMHQGGTD